MVAAVLIVTPGPDTAMVMRSAIRSGQRGASATAFGVGLGSAVWGVASILGLGLLLESSALAFTALKLLGAGYLILLGVLALRGGHGLPEEGATEAKSLPAKGARSPFLQGVICNLLNPKAGVIFVAVFPQFMRAGDSPWRFALMLAAYELILLVWLNLFGSVIVRSARSAVGQRVRKVVSRVTGFVLIGLGLRVALETR
jgi:threonine/homoserine/homoserine lactone efflux protein